MSGVVLKGSKNNSGGVHNSDDSEQWNEHEEDSMVIIHRLYNRGNTSNDSEANCEEAIVKMNGSNFYAEEWNKLFKSPDYLSVIRKRAVKGGLRSCRFRSICWRIHLHSLPEDMLQWIAAAEIAHSEYEELKSKFLVNPRGQEMSKDPLINNPLSQEEASPWNQYFQDTDLKQTITQDVIRTFPEVEFFQSVAIRELMVNILFCYARTHPHMSYRQGMHELLAPLVFVLHSDQQAFMHAREIEFIDLFETAERKALEKLLEPSHLEHDAYSMFCNMMDNVESWYLIRDINPSKCSLMFRRPFSTNSFDANIYNAIVSKLTYIQDLLLRRHDHDLYTHLEKMEIAPQIYGIRWLRLMFGREFALQDLLVIWDVVFADSSNFGLVDYIFISMLVYIRDQLMSSDYSSCLEYLMRYPTVVDVQYIINMALYLREPKKYPKPTNYGNQMVQHKQTVGGRAEIHRAPVPQKNEPTPPAEKEKLQTRQGYNMISGISTLTKKMTSRPKTLGLTVTNSPHSSTNEASFESPSRLITPERGEYAQAEASYGYEEPACDQIPYEVKLSAPKTETEMRLMQRDSGQLDRASTLPRSFGGAKHQRVPSTTQQRHHEVGDVMSQSMDSHWQEQYGVTVGVVAEEDGATELVSARHRRHGSASHIPKPVLGKDAILETAYLQGKLNDVQSMNGYCSQKMTSHIDRLQECILKQHLENEDEMLVALAGMKQVRDILKGTLKFSENILDSDDIVINDDHYPTERIEKEES